MESLLTLIRGLPGSGKSTYAKKLADKEQSLHYEADMFFVNDSGVYEFDYTKLKEAHAWCLEATAEALSSNSKVIVSNTFTEQWEIDKYLELVHYDSQVRVFTLTTMYENIHDVPDEVMDRMRNRFLTLPEETYIYGLKD